MKHMTLTLLLAMTALIAGCDKGGETAAKPNPNEKLFPASLFVTDAPAGEMGIAKIKSENLAVGKEVVVTGTIGGRKAPLAAKFATMSIVCETLPVPKEACGCDDAGWVFSCEPKDKLMPHQASVQILDGTMPIKASLEGIKGITGGKVVSIKGTIATNEGGGLIINATEIYVHPAATVHVDGEGCAHDEDGEEPGHDEDKEHVAETPAAPAALAAPAPVATHAHGPDCTH